MADTQLLGGPPHAARPELLPNLVVLGGGPLGSEPSLLEMLEARLRDGFVGAGTAPDAPPSQVYIYINIYIYIYIYIYI